MPVLWTSSQYSSHAILAIRLGTLVTAEEVAAAEAFEEWIVRPYAES